MLDLKYAAATSINFSLSAIVSLLAVTLCGNNKGSSKEEEEEAEKLYISYSKRSALFFYFSSLVT